MPAKYRVKTFAPESFYHVYNRGVEKRDIFVDDQDRAVFMSYLKAYILPKDIKTLQSCISDPSAGWKQKDLAKKLLRMNNFSDTIQLVAFCLMSNHFHMLIKQADEGSMHQFMNSLWTRYAMYFNKKYHRVGPLFQDVYKAVMVITEEQLLHLTRYIHRNPIAKRHFRNPASQGSALRTYKWSSHRVYVGLEHADWIKSNIILAHWNHDREMQYEAFVLESDNEMSAKIIAPIIIAS